MKTRIKRLLYQSWYRGCKETDRILGNFARAYLEKFSEAEIDAFEKIMQESDKDLFNWLTHQQPMPVEYKDCPVMQKLLDFKVY